MKRTVRRDLIHEWVRAHRPDGMSALCQKSKIPYSSAIKIRAGHVPMSLLQRSALAAAIGVTEAELFPVLQDEEGQAS